ncbi:MAG: LlaJI family restriction endonuclease [Alloprevotella sp.]|nr:LlaJI family restriction endonuclease [Alloprevotella sp.]
MRILIEEHQYRAEAVENIITGLTNLRNIKGKVSVNHVGYYYNPALNDGHGDMVFILPKVLLQDVKGEELLFGKYPPEQVINISEQQLLTPQEYDFVYKLSVWVYRAIVVFRDAHPESDVVQQQLVQHMSNGRLQECNTFLDILLALLKFNRDNQDFFFFVLRNLHSGFNKINWTRTISKSQAVVQDDVPIYLNPVNKRRQVNFDEELLVIFFSILNHMRCQYGFPVSIPVNYELITGAKFNSYLNGQGCIKLLKIKNKYFSDKAIYLWELCYAFFDLSRKVKVEVSSQEYILVKNFNIVFEAIIDELIGTDRKQLPARLADQSDGKTVDHLWIDDILLPTNDKTAVYYIGDSKYYKYSTPVGENSISKQFSYARNVIQWSFDALKGSTGCEDERYKIRLRDDRTEGYNILPNFFISAKVDFEKLDYGAENLVLHEGQNQYESSQFSDRLFDRDTLLLSHYDVNFLYVLAMYARNNATSKQAWKTAVRKRFRERVQEILSAKYTFYALKGYDAADSEQYITTHFQELLGKLYRTPNEQSIYTLAVERKGDGENALIQELRKHFYVTECRLEDNVQDKINEQVSEQGLMPVGKCVVVDDNLCEQTAEHIRRVGSYAIGLGDTFGALALAEGFMKAQFLVLHKLTNPIVFALKSGPQLITKEQLNDTPFKMKDSQVYILFHIEGEEPLIAERISQYALNHPPKGYSRRQSYVTDINSMLQV